MTEGIEYASKAVKDATCGNFDMKLYYGEQLSKSKENLDGISIGAFEMAQFCSFYHKQKNPSITVTELPFKPCNHNIAWYAYLFFDLFDSLFIHLTASHISGICCPVYIHLHR